MRQENELKTQDEDSTNSLSEEIQKDITVEMKLLARTWVDDFEKETFDGKTLDELLGQRDYA